MGIILNDAKPKYKTGKTLLQTLIDESPLTNHELDQIIEAYESDEETAMNLMANCDSGKFSHDFSGGWKFELNED